MIRCLRVSLAVLLLVCGCAAQSAKPALFQFEGNFWVSLHDLLYWHAQAPQCPQGELNGECTRLYDITPGDQDAWKMAVNWYAGHVASRSLLFDEEMIRINNVLAQLGPDDNLDHRGLPDRLVDALRTAAPIYRKYYLPDQEYRDQRWVTAITPKLEKYGEPITKQLSSVYGMPWPTQPIRVDLVAYGGRPGGAYTTLNPTLIVISSADARNQADSALEVLFHEASHALVLSVREQIAREFRAHNKPVPEKLWHVLLFYTTGEIVRRALPGYVPYAVRNNLYKDPEWAHARELLERDWKPYLDGETDRNSAIAKLAAEY